MYVCQICGSVVPPRTPAIRVIVCRRSKHYPFRHHANVFLRPDSNGKVKEHTTHDPGGVGWEIAREVLSCAACAELADEDAGAKNIPFYRRAGPTIEDIR